MTPSRLSLVYTQESIPLSGPSVFLAGPTPRSRDVASWRPDAVAEIRRQWTGPGPLTVFLPEPRSGLWQHDYDDQFIWELAARAAATALLYWIPRDLRTLPGFTTNVEFGADATSGRAVLGAPPNCPDARRNRYLIHLAHHHGVPVHEDLPTTVTTALHLTQPHPPARHRNPTDPPH